MLNSGEVNLDRYRCAKCNRKPSDATEILKGCTCGHRLFRLQLNNNSVKKESPNSSILKQERPSDMGFLTIRERRVGIYDINVEKLLEPEKTRDDSAVIAGNNGIYSIKLDSHKKKTTTH